MTSTPSSHQQAAETPFQQLVTSDVVMPGMSGIELGNAARRLSKMKGMLASGYAATALKGLGQGDDFAVITKPYTMAQVLRQLR